MPLVSIVVITYNSSRTIIKTLESIKKQTYNNIELLISDDCSTDETTEIVSNWLKSFGSVFMKAKLISTTLNTGISANLNRGVRETSGEWIKTIAGDDTLEPNAIEEYISFVNKCSENVNMCVCDVNCFSEEAFVPQSLIKEYENYFKLEKQPLEAQYVQILQENIFVGPTFFYTKKLYDLIGGFSNEYGNGEEWPFVYKVLKSGNRIYAVDKKLVNYRFSLSSLSHNRDNDGLRNKNLELSSCKFFFDYPFRDLLKERRYLLAWDRFLYYKTRQLYYENNGIRWFKILMKLSRILSPNACLLWIKNKFK